jgi:ABC-type nitrate/sulfonate/bicarbonate transport system substrate-binding protein
MKLNRRNFLKIAGVFTLSLWAGDRLVRAAKPLVIDLPAMQDSVPLLFGSDKGVFAKDELSIVAFDRQEESDGALLAKQTDGRLTDITTALLMVAADFPIVIVSTAFELLLAPNGTPQARSLIMLSKEPAIQKLDDLAKYREKTGKPPLRVLERSDMLYQTDQLLRSNGFKGNLDDVYEFVGGGFGALQQQAEQLGVGIDALKAVTLPGVHADLARITRVANKAPVFTLTEFENEKKLMPTVMIFRKEIVERRTEELKKFYAKFAEAVDATNKSTRAELINTLLKVALKQYFETIKPEQLGLPPGWESQVRIPVFPKPRALKSDELNTIHDWATARRYLREKVTYDQAVFSGIFGKA